MIIAIHQPNYLPWLGFFHKMGQADLLVLLDNVPYSKNSYQNRNKIRTSHGEQWLTVPVLTTGAFGQLTYEVRIDKKQKWQQKHWRTLEQNYSKSQHFDEYKAFFQNLYLNNKWHLLARLNEELIRYIASSLGITTPIIRASQLGVRGSGTELLLDICLAVEANVYLSGPSGAHYLDIKQFAENQVDVIFHQFRHPVYPQLSGPFRPNMAAIDLLLNCGPTSNTILFSNAGED